MKKLLLLATALSLGGCASIGLKDPWGSGKFDLAVWQADMQQIRAAAKTGGQAALAAMDALCPGIPQASNVVNDPRNQSAAQALFGVHNATKNINNINAALTLLNDACAVRDAKVARDVIVTGAQAINDAKAIFAKANGAK